MKKIPESSLYTFNLDLDSWKFSFGKKSKKTTDKLGDWVNNWKMTFKWVWWWWDNGHHMDCIAVIFSDLVYNFTTWLWYLISYSSISYIRVRAKYGAQIWLSNSLLIIQFRLTALGEWFFSILFCFLSFLSHTWTPQLDSLFWSGMWLRSSGVSSQNASNSSSVGFAIDWF